MGVHLISARIELVGAAFAHPFTQTRPIEARLRELAPLIDPPVDFGFL
jgi:hypothetical protein